MAEEFREPQSANEAALQNWAGADNELRAPQSRIEKLLLAILGEDVTPDPPQSVNEELLTQILEQGFGSDSEPSEFVFNMTSDLTQHLYFTQTESKGVSIDWGDGSAVEKIDGTECRIEHTFPSAGKYTVKFYCKDGATWSPGIVEAVGSLHKYSFLGEYNFSKSPSFPTLEEALISGNVKVAPLVSPFKLSTGLRKVVFKDSYSGNIFAFENCSALEEVIIGN